MVERANIMYHPTPASVPRKRSLLTASNVRSAPEDDFDEQDTETCKFWAPRSRTPSGPQLGSPVGLNKERAENMFKLSHLQPSTPSIRSPLINVSTSAVTPIKGCFSDLPALPLTPVSPLYIF